MNMKFTSTEDSYRGQAWCMSAELTDNGDGTYTIKDERASKMLGGGIGSEIVVIDIPGKFLFVGDDGLAYDWTASSSGDDGGDQPPAGYVTVVPKQSVTLTGSEEEMAQLTTVDGYEVEDPMPENLLVKVNGTVVSYDGEGYDYRYSGDSVTYLVTTFTPLDYRSTTREVVAKKFGFIALDAMEQPVAGTYEVVIYEPAQ